LQSINSQAIIKLFGVDREASKMPKTDRRAGRVPPVGKLPRARRQDGAWRKKRSDTGKKRVWHL